MNNSSTPNDTFHLGITMAGAVSAGCYTAGVMDYLFEILELWEEAKVGRLPEGWNQDMLPLIPQHNVVIDAMGGASAGGMTTVISAIYAMKGRINPVTDTSNPEYVKDNLLYDSWVLMGDQEKDPEKVFEKAFHDTDLKSGKIASLLNSDFIDGICDTAFEDNGSEKRLPPYISEDLEILLSQTMLRSVPMPINFSTPFGRIKPKKPKPENDPKYNTFDHFVVSHFKLNYDETNPQHKDFYLPFAPFSEDKNVVETLKQATKATGAFPVALKFRKFFNNEFSSEYIKNNSKKLLHHSMNPHIREDNSIELENVPQPFQFVGVDGGTINNEPIGEILNILKERYPKDENSEDPNLREEKFALIMIDPFPDHIFPEDYKQPEDVFSVIPSLIGTLKNQARLKRREMMDFHKGKYFTGEIFPMRYKGSLTENHHIACSSVHAFGGFLDISFRHHDFFLGRDNAKNFFRAYLSIEYNPEAGKVHPIHKNWTPEMINLLKKKKRGRIFLPIIPDLHYLKRKFENKSDGSPYKRTVKEWPKYDPEKLIRLAPKIENRFKKIIELTYEKMMDKKEQPAEKKEYAFTKQIMDKHYKKGIRAHIGECIAKGYLYLNYRLIKGKAARKATRSVIEEILKNLEEMDLLKKP